jgi:hypothetical protein
MTPGESAWPARFGDRLRVTLLFAFFTGLALLFVWSGEVADHSWMNHDAANAAYVGARIAQGDVLYVDWAYYVMPSVVLWPAGTHLAGGLFGLSGITAFHLSLLAVAALGVAVLRRALGGAAAQPPFAPVAAYLAVLVYPGIFAYDFGQREHLFALLLIPYLLWRCSGRAIGAPVYVLLIALGFTAMIKPHFGIVVAVAELFFVAERGRRARVWAALSAGALLPLGLLVLHSPDALSGLFERAIPYHMSGSYDRYTTSFSSFVRSTNSRVLLGLGAALGITNAALAIRGQVPLRKIAASLAVCVVLYGSIVHQSKYFGYHTLPFFGMTLVLTVTGAWLLAQSLSDHRWRRGATAVLSLLPLVLLASGCWNLYTLFRKPPSPHIAPLLPHLEGERLILLMSPAVEGGIFRYALSHDFDVMRPWTSHYTVHDLLALEDPEARRQAVAAYFDRLTTGLEEEKPGLVVFSPTRLPWNEPTLHQSFVEDHGLFPVDGYEFAAQTTNGWRVYRRAGGVRAGAMPPAAP